MMAEGAPILLGAVVLGFVGSGHCIGMCGGIAGALGQRSTGSNTALSPVLSSLCYSLGRVGSYSLLGAIVGLLGESVHWLTGSGPSLRVLAGLLIVVLGLRAVGFGIAWVKVERAGLRIWRKVSPLMGRIGPPDRVWKQLVLGGLWGWLPCGLVYSALAAASVTGGVASGAAFMFCFGVGTIPALVVTGGAASKIAGTLRQRSARRALGALLIVFGGWTIYAALAPMHGGDHRHPPAHVHDMRS